MGILEKFEPMGYVTPGKRPQVHPETRIGIHLVLDQRRDHRRGYGYGVPVFGLERRAGKNLTLLVHFAGRLQAPSLAQKKRGIVAGAG